MRGAKCGSDNLPPLRRAEKRSAFRQAINAKDAMAYQFGRRHRVPSCILRTQSLNNPVPGFMPGIHVFVEAVNRSDMAGWFYMTANRRNGTLYAGSSVHLARRAWEHREGIGGGFTKKYGLKRLVYFERYDDIREARRREEAIKHWPRAWKVRLIHSVNPDWDDLCDQLL